MKYLICIGIYMLHFMSFSAQVLISDDVNTLDSSILKTGILMKLEAKNKDKALIIPKVETSNSIVNKLDGMLAYNIQDECFVYYRDNWVSQCIVERISDKVIDHEAENSIIPAVYNSSIYYNIGLSNNNIQITSKKFAIIEVSASHQYATSGTPICAHQELALFINGTKVKSLEHRTISTSTGNIYPVHLQWIGVLDPAINTNYTVELKFKNLETNNCNPNSINRYTSVNVQTVLKEIK